MTSLNPALAALIENALADGAVLCLDFGGLLIEVRSEDAVCACPVADEPESFDA